MKARILLLYFHARQELMFLGHRIEAEMVGLLAILFKFWLFVTIYSVK